MAGRSPARFLAPLALVAFAIAFFVIISNATKDSGEQASPAGSTPAKTAKSGEPAKKKHKKKPKTYVVKAGDTPSGIAVKVGVPLDTLLQLNPELDPQAMTPGTKLKVR